MHGQPHEETELQIATTRIVRPGPDFLPRQAIGLGAQQTINRCHHGHFKALNKCRLVGWCVRPGENFFT